MTFDEELLAVIQACLSERATAADRE